MKSLVVDSLVGQLWVTCGLWVAQGIHLWVDTHTHIHTGTGTHTHKHTHTHTHTHTDTHIHTYLGMT
jgi:hypothetical protein